MKYADLAPEVQQRLLQQEAQFMSGDCWWSESVDDDFKTDGVERGFDIEEMFWSGFSSQGDGASWVGTVDIGRFLACHLAPTNPQYARYVVLQELVAGSRIDTYAKITAEGHYSHEYSMRCGDVEADVVGGTMHEGVLQGADTEVLFDSIDGDNLLSDLEEWILEQAQDYARKYYAALESEYDYLTGEDALIERDLDYDEEGEEVADAGETVSPEEPEAAGCSQQLELEI